MEVEGSRRPRRIDKTVSLEKGSQVAPQAVRCDLVCLNEGIKIYSLKGLFKF